MRSVIFAVTFLMMPPPVLAHDVWSDGSEVPSWVKAECCGKSDAHQIPASAIHITADGYKIDGINTEVPFSRALPSQDGGYWGFWNPTMAPDVTIYCFFAPLNGA